MLNSIEQAVHVWCRKLREYLAYPSVVGFEKPFIKKLSFDLQALNIQVQTQHNLLVACGKKADSHAFSAHIDRHGLIANGKGELEYAAYKVKSLEYREEKEMIQSFWEKVMDRFRGEQVYAYEPETGRQLGEGRVKKCFLCGERQNFIFLVDELKELPENTPVSFSRDCHFANERFSGQIDNVISVALAYTLFLMGYQGSFLFTTDEEIGRSWQHLLSYFKTNGISQMQELLVLDTTPFSEEDEVREVNMDSVVFRKKDAGGKFNAQLVNTYEKLALAHQIPHFFKDQWIEQRTPQGKKASLGKTELGTLASESEGSYNGTTIQIPTLAYHSNNETATRQAMTNMMRLMTLILWEGRAGE